MATMKSQKELKEKFSKIIRTEVWQDEQMQQYSIKESDYIVELSNGNIISIDRPGIEKDFCFGYGMYANYTDEQLERAEALSEKARNDVHYFMEQNMNQVTHRIDALKSCLDGQKECYTYVRYSGQPVTSDLVWYSVCNICNNPQFSPYKWNRLGAVRKLGNEDIERLIAGYEEVLKKFEKRLNTYLKRYGLKKLNVWTYCVD